MLRSTTRTAALLAIALLLCTSAWAVQGAGAQASKRPTAGSHITAKMVFDCAHMTKEALNYAVQHNYCSAPTASPTGIVQPNTSYPAQGDCGRTEVQIYNTGQSGRAGFYEDVLSYAGPIARLSYTVN